MDVYRAVFRHGESIVRQDAPVGDDDEISGSSAFICASAVPSRIFTGWNTGRPFSSASSLTGDAHGSIPRPLGLSGWVNTPTTSRPFIYQFFQ